MKLIDREMTESEIMKALECCGDEEVLHWCTECPYYDKENDLCQEDLHRDALALLNRKNAEIERLEKSKRLSDDLIEQMRITINNRTTENQKLKLDNEELKIINKNLDKLFLKARAEASKEFAERVTEALCEADDVNPLTEWKIDQIAKEMGVEL